jgi:hypothetical protein
MQRWVMDIEWEPWEREEEKEEESEKEETSEKPTQ